MAGICDIPIISNVCDAVGEGAATLVAAPFDWLAQAIGQAASWIFQGVWALFDSTTLVDVTGAGYIGVYNVIFGIAIFIMLIFFCLQLITGLIRRDPTALSRAALGVAKSVLGSFLVITLTATLLEVVDQLCIGIIQATGSTLEEMGGKIGVLVAGLTAINLTAPGAGAIITIFLSFLAICAAAIVWFSLLIRKALILVAVVMAPIALSGASWDATKGWFGKWASFVLALIFSKLVVVVVFLVAINQVDAPIDLDLSSIADPIAGIVLMFIAAFAPYMVYKFISFVGFDMYHVMSARTRVQAVDEPAHAAARKARRCRTAEGPRRRRQKRWQRRRRWREPSATVRQTHPACRRRRIRGCGWWEWRCCGIWRCGCRFRWWCGSCGWCRGGSCGRAGRDRRGCWGEDRQGSCGSWPEARRRDRPHRRQPRRSRRRSTNPATDPGPLHTTTTEHAAREHAAEGTARKSRRRGRPTATTEACPEVLMPPRT